MPVRSGYDEAVTGLSLSTDLHHLLLCRPHSADRTAASLTPTQEQQSAFYYWPANSVLYFAVGAPCGRCSCGANSALFMLAFMGFDSSDCRPRGARVRARATFLGFTDTLKCESHTLQLTDNHDWLSPHALLCFTVCRRIKAEVCDQWVCPSESQWNKRQKLKYYCCWCQRGWWF